MTYRMVFYDCTAKKHFSIGTEAPTREDADGEGQELARAGKRVGLSIDFVCSIEYAGE